MGWNQAELPPPDADERPRSPRHAAPRRLVSQFTLEGRLKGNKIDFSASMPPAAARVLFGAVVARTSALYSGLLQTGAFGEMMDVQLVNDGPVTIQLDTREQSFPRGRRKPAKGAGAAEARAALPGAASAPEAGASAHCAVVQSSIAAPAAAASDAAR